MIREKDELLLLKRRIFLMKCKWIFFVLPFYASAQLIQAPQTPYEEFQAYLETEEINSYSHFQLQEIKKQSESVKSLSFLLEQAQRSFLKGHLKQAGDYFRSIVEQAYDNDWNKEIKDMIFYSYLRLAQIEWKDNPNHFLYSALIFAPSFKPDESLFPPPLIRKFNKIKNKQPLLKIKLGRIFPFHETILINGKSFSKKSISLPYGNYRVTALSSSHQPWSQKISLSDLAQKRIVTPPWAGGNCNNPSVSKKIKKENILYPQFCRWNPNLKLVKEEKVTSNLIIENNIKQKIKATLKNNKKWIWTGVIATGVTVGIIFLNREQPSTPSIPTIRKGFPKN